MRGSHLTSLSTINKCARILVIYAKILSHLTQVHSMLAPIFVSSLELFRN